MRLNTGDRRAWKQYRNYKLRIQKSQPGRRKDKAMKEFGKFFSNHMTIVESDPDFTKLLEEYGVWLMFGKKSKRLSN